MTTTAEPRRGAVEIRSIDYVPLAERHGKLWHLGAESVIGSAEESSAGPGVSVDSSAVSSGNSLRPAPRPIPMRRTLGT